MVSLRAETRVGILLAHPVFAGLVDLFSAPVRRRDCFPKFGDSSLSARQ
jgi:hypothetical protein